MKRTLCFGVSMSANDMDTSSGVESIHSPSDSITSGEIRDKNRIVSLKNFNPVFCLITPHIYF